MLTLRTDGAGEFRVPTHPSEIEFGAFCDFRVADEKLHREPEANLAQRELYMTEAVEQLVTGDVRSIPLYPLIGETIEQEISVLGLYQFVVRAINAYEPEEVPVVAKVERDGKLYVAEWEPTARALRHRALTSGESLIVLELQRLSALNPGNLANEGNVDFSLGCAQMAILVRQVGEELPVNQTERDEFIRERSKMWAHVDLATVLDLRHYFMSACLVYAKTRGSSFSGKENRGRVVQAVRRKHRRRKKQQRR